MKALSIRQPWAHLIFYAASPLKDIENRDWPTLHRGRIAIHAAQTRDTDELAAARYFMRERGIKIDIAGAPEFALGAIIGTVDLIDCVTDSESPWFVGSFGFVLRNPIALTEPTPCRGARGLWDVPVEIERLMAEARPADADSHKEQV